MPINSLDKIEKVDLSDLKNAAELIQKFVWNKSEATIILWEAQEDLRTNVYKDIALLKTIIEWKEDVYRVGEDIYVLNHTENWIMMFMGIDWKAHPISEEDFNERLKTENANEKLFTAETIKEKTIPSTLTITNWDGSVDTVVSLLRKDFDQWMEYGVYLREKDTKIRKRSKIFLADANWNRSKIKKIRGNNYSDELITELLESLKDNASKKINVIKLEGIDFRVDMSCNNDGQVIEVRIRDENWVESSLEKQRSKDNFIENSKLHKRLLVSYRQNLKTKENQDSLT